MKVEIPTEEARKIARAANYYEIKLEKFIQDAIDMALLDYDRTRHYVGLKEREMR